MVLVVVLEELKELVLVETRRADDDCVDFEVLECLLQRLRYLKEEFLLVFFCFGGEGFVLSNVLLYFSLEFGGRSGDEKQVSDSFLHGDGEQAALG